MEQSPVVPRNQLPPKGTLVWLIKANGERANSTPYHIRGYELGSDGVTVIATFLESAVRWPAVRLEALQLDFFRGDDDACTQSPSTWQ